ncbi:xanthine dehydrogenase family protein molybdopterin-binding subunit [Kitasatospora camelliae]|uniref:Xanthine dehydrogenase family protein molybdopterin-binding subunit n=1 Tax=Kitasatospora camelliae TaxID=3156397 RepID=A0AAU8K559_9ACTN
MADLRRLEGREKVTGAARYAADVHPPDCVFAVPVPATVARGTVTAVHTAAALADPRVLAVLTHRTARRLHPVDDPALAVLQSPKVAHRGQYVALVVAETLRAAEQAAAEIRVDYRQEPHDVLLTEDHPRAYTPEEANGGHPAQRAHGDFAAVYAAAEVRLDAVYRIGPLHNHALEPHAATAWWQDGRLTVHDSSQGATLVQETLAALFGLERDRVLVVSEHVGGGFGAKGTPRPHVVLAALAAQEVGRPVQLSLPRAQLAAVVGHRAPSVQRVRLAADRAGGLLGLAHEVLSQTSTVREFVEQTAVPARVMYRSPAALTVHRVVAQDIPTPSWMRAPGECPGMFALESAMDELAQLCGLDPVELRLRNEPDREPDTERRFSSRHLAECLREGARRFGWADRDPSPGVRREGRLLVGTGVAASTYPALVAPSTAEVRAESDGTYRVLINATDIGTGARTALAVVAAEALEVPADRVRVDIGRSDLPRAPLAGGSCGTASWGWAVHKAATGLRAEPGLGTVRASTREEVKALDQSYARHAFGAQFAEVQVDVDTGEVRLRRLLGVFAAGRIVNPPTARSQLVGGMVMGASMALLEESTMDPAFGDHAERDLAAYHVAVNADVPRVDAYWIDEDDPHLNPPGAKGIGELGIVGTAAAVANAVHHATGIRVRRLPLSSRVLLQALESAHRQGRR